MAAKDPQGKGKKALGRVLTQKRLNVRNSTKKLANTLERFFPNGCCKAVFHYEPGQAQDPSLGIEERKSRCRADIKPITKRIVRCGGRYVSVVGADLQSVTLFLNWGAESVTYLAKMWGRGEVTTQELEVETDWAKLARELMAPHLEAGCNTGGFHKWMWTRSVNTPGGQAEKTHRQ